MKSNAIQVIDSIRLFMVGIGLLAGGTTLLGQTIVIQPYLQDLSQDEVTIMWETETDGLGSVFYGETPFTVTMESSSTTIVGSGSSRIHAATLSSLVHGSKHYYKVVMADATESKLATFQTLQLPSEQQNTQFIAMSDMQRDGSQPNKFEEIVEQGIIPIIHSEIGDSLYDLEAILIPGDLVVTGGNYSQWENDFFTKADSLTPHVPIYPVPGNHEYFSNGLPNFKKYFTLPTNGVPSLLEECWYKDISNVRIIGLNSNSGGADQDLQLDWLQEILDSACVNEDIDFVFAELHHPFKSELWTPGENSFAGKMIDSLENFTTDCGKASVHFFGHTHGYSRGQSRDHKHVWMNVATAGGAIDNWGEFPNADYEEFVKSQDEYGFVLLDVEAGDDPMFTIKRYSRGDQDIILDNVLRDTLTILNKDIAPETPANIFPNGDTVLSYCVTLKASDFYGSEDTHQASHWQLAEDTLFTSTTLTEKWSQSENFYNEVNTQAGDDLTDEGFENIDGVDSLYWRVRYRNQNLEWSKWSQPTVFYLTGAVDTISTDLVLNGGAEDGINNWTGDIEALEQSECGSVPPHAGDYNFGIGGICQNESAVGTATQTVGLSTYQTEIDNDNLSLSFGAYIRNFSGSDIPELYVELYDDDQLVVTSSILSNVTPTWTLVSGLVSVPAGVDSCTVVLKGTRTSGSDNDSYFDDIRAYLVDVDDCPTCFGLSGQDGDGDGYCRGLDCDDENGAIYPGAIEQCNGLDDNCDGLADAGPIVTWTGLGGNTLWGDVQNWDQPMVPLPCQHVVIDNTSLVTVDSVYECLSLELAASNQLQITATGYLLINSDDSNTLPSATIAGTMTIDGRCDLKKSQGLGIEVYGILINNNRLNLSDINLDNLLLRSGGRFDSIGRTVFK